MRPIMPGEKPYGLEKKESYLYCKTGEVTRVDDELQLMDIHWLESPGGRSMVPMTFPLATARSFMGGYPEEGAIVVCGFIQHSNNISDPIPLAYLPPAYLIALRGHEITDEAYNTTLRYKMRKLKKGEQLISSTFNSDILCNEDIQLINSRLCEILLRSDDQNIILSSINNTVITDLNRQYFGNIIRNDRIDSVASYDANGNPLLVNGFLKPIVSPSGERIFIVTDNLSANTIDEGGKPYNEHRIEVTEYGQSRMSVLDENIKEDVDTIDPIVTKTMGTVVGNDTGDTSTYGRVYRPQIFDSYNSTAKNLDNIPCTSLDEETKLAGCYELKFASGSIITVNKEGKAFLHFQGSSSLDPMGTNRSIEFQNDGSVKILIGRNVEQEESWRGDRAGRTTQVWGRDDSYDEVSHDISKAGRTNENFGRDDSHDEVSRSTLTNGRINEVIGRDDSYDQISINQNCSGKVKKTIGYSDTDKISYDILTNGGIKMVVNKDTANERSLDIDTSNGIKVNINNPDLAGNAIELYANGKSVATITDDVTEIYQNNQTTQVTNTKKIEAAEILLDGENGSSAGLKGCRTAGHYCPLTGLKLEAMGGPGALFSTNVKASEE